MPTGIERKAKEALLVLVEAARVPHSPAPSPRVTEVLNGLFDAAPLQALLLLSPAEARRSILGVRAAKDARLKRALVNVFKGPGIVFNPCCVFGRHAKDLARRLPEVQVVASDLDPFWHRLYSVLDRIRRRPPPTNYHFDVGDAYDPRPDLAPDVVCVFGACGSLADAALDMAVHRGSNVIAVRACCHENIGMNVRISTFRPTVWNMGHRIKNVIYAWEASRRGLYFHPRFDGSAYPRSAIARAAMDPSTVRAVARHAVDCSVCREMIDLDRTLYLMEHGYEILGHYDGTVVAHRTNARSSS